MTLLGLWEPRSGGNARLFLPCASAPALVKNKLQRVYRSAPWRKSHLGRQPEARTVHALRRRDVPDQVHRDLALLDLAYLSARTILHPIPLHGKSQLPGNPLADIEPRRLVVTLEREAVSVNDGQIGVGVRRKEVLVARVEPAVVREELDRGRGQVHDEVRDRRRDRDDGGWGPLDFGIAARELLLGGYHGCLAGLGGSEDAVGGLVYEDAAVLVEGPDKGRDLSVSAKRSHECEHEE